MIKSNDNPTLNNNYLFIEELILILIADIMRNPS